MSVVEVEGRCFAEKFLGSKISARIGLGIKVRVGPEMGTLDFHILRDAFHESVAANDIASNYTRCSSNMLKSDDIQAMRRILVRTMNRMNSEKK